MKPKFGKTKGGQAYPKRTKKEIKGLTKLAVNKLATKRIATVKNVRIIHGERNAIYKDTKGNLLVIDPRDHRLGLVNIKGEYLSKENVLEFIKKHERQLKNKIKIKNGEIIILRKIANQKDATANKVIHEEHLLMKKRIPEEEIHRILVDRHGGTASEIIRNEHILLDKGIPEGKVHDILRKTYG